MSSAPLLATGLTRKRHLAIHGRTTLTTQARPDTGTPCAWHGLLPLLRAGEDTVDMHGWLQPSKLYIIGSIVTVGFAILANVFAPGTLTTIAATFAILVPLVALLIPDRLAAQKEMNDVQERLLAEIRNAGQSSGQVVSLGSDNDAWVEYIERNAAGARSILNTRLSGSDGVFTKYHQRIDDAILRAVASGTDYELICSTEQTRTLRGFLRRLPTPDSRAARAAGNVTIWSLDTADKPLLQMKIFNYGEYEEAMIGFLSRRPSDAEMPIFLVRHPDVVKYMRLVFRTYCGDPGAARLDLAELV